jgi:hypothetical protein
MQLAFGTGLVHQLGARVLGIRRRLLYAGALGVALDRPLALELAPVR